MEFTAITCDICGTQKKETNHWLVAITGAELEGIIFQPAEATASPRNPLFTYSNLCGSQCSLKRLNRYTEELRSLFNSIDERNQDDRSNINNAA